MHADMAQNRIRKPVNVTLDPELLAILDGYIDELNRQPGPLKTSRTAVIEAAVQEYLAKHQSQKKSGKK